MYRENQAEGPPGDGHRRRIAFVLEQALGHVTHAKNLQHVVPRHPEIEPVWLPIPFEVRGLAARVPLYRSNWTVRAGWRARRALAKAASQGRLDGLFCHTQVPGVLAADWVRRLPAVVSLDATPIQYDQLGEFYQHARGPEWLEQLKLRLHHGLFDAADHLVTWTAWTKESLVTDYGVPRHKITVIPPGVHPEQWARPEPRSPGSEKKSVRILFVGGNLARKGGELLLESFRALHSRGMPPVELDLVTRTAVKPRPGQRVHSDIVPNDPRLIKLYHEADIFCLPTFGDCLPMVLSEAGAAGLPVVSTDIAGIPEIIAHGESGILVPPHDGQALTKALTRLTDDADLRMRMGGRAIEIVNERFDAAQNASRLIDLVKATVDRAKAGKYD